MWLVVLMWLLRQTWLVRHMCWDTHAWPIGRSPKRGWWSCVSGGFSVVVGFVWLVGLVWLVGHVRLVSHV